MLLPILLTIFATTKSLPTTCNEVFLKAEISSNLKKVAGVLTCKTLTTKDLVAVTTFPRLFRDTPPLDDIERHWMYPNGFNPADMQLFYDNRPLESAGPWQPLPQLTTAQTTVEIQFTTTIPERLSTFGKQNKMLFLLGGWHPMFGNGTTIDRVPIHYTIKIPQNLSAWIANNRQIWHAKSASQVLEGTFVGRSLPIILAPSFQTYSQKNILVLEARNLQKSSANDSPYHLQPLDFGRDQLAKGQLLLTLKRGQNYADEHMFPSTPLTVVLMPIRDHLTDAFEGGFAVSDRAFHLLQYEKFLKFHRASIWREQFLSLLLPMCFAKETPSVWPKDTFADALASAFLEDMMQSYYGNREQVTDLLETFAIIPEIDALIFAPQIPFKNSYFSAIDESETWRHHPRDYYHPFAAGKRLYEKLLDRIGFAKTLAIAQGYLKANETWFDTIKKQTDLDGETLLGPWFKDYPKMDYYLGQVSEQNNKATVTVLVKTEHEKAPIEEPITVAVEDASGKKYEQTRLGVGELHFNDITTPLQSIEIDPNGRLVELLHEPGTAPKYNNRTPSRWRFLLNNIAGLFAVTNRQVSASIDFTLRQIHDLKYLWNFFAEYTPGASGVGAVLSRGFGQEITPLRLAERVGVVARAEYLQQERGQGATGMQTSAGLFYSYDTRLNPYWSYVGHGVSLNASFGSGPTLAIDGATTHEIFLRTSASMFYILPLASKQALLGRVRGDLLWGTAPTQEELRLGGRYIGGRGFEPDEAHGTKRGLLSLEYRHDLIGDTRTDLGGLLRWDRLDGALFADAIYLPTKRDDCGSDFYYDVGYGLRFIGDIINFSPGSFQIDIGIPINRCSNETGRVPVTVYAAFVQSFAFF